MTFDGFKIIADAHIIDATCRQCHHDMSEISNGWFSSALFCPHCDSVYVLKMIRVSDGNVTPEFIKQAKEEIQRKRKKFDRAVAAQ